MNTWEIRTTQSGLGFYQDRLAFEGTFDEAIEFAKSRYQVLRTNIAIHRPHDEYAYYWINSLGETNRNHVN